MVIENPLYLQTREYSARHDRFLTDYLFTEGVTNVGAGQLRVTQRAGGPTMSVDVAAGTAVIDGDDTPDQGAYLVRVTAAENVTIPAPPATNSRIDLVVLQVRDSTATGTDPGLDGAALRVISGAAAASPVAPATPPSALLLARVTVAAGVLSVVDANITDTRVQVNKADIAIGTQAEPMTTATRDALTGADLFTGRVIFNTTDSAVQTYGGASLGWLAGGKADVQTFTASGTWTKPQGAQTVHVTVIGAGGAGAGVVAAASSGTPGGGGGATATRTLSSADLAATVPTTVGAGGVGSGGAGTSGGSSSFGTYLAAYGGGGGGGFGYGGAGGGGAGGAGATSAVSAGGLGGVPDGPTVASALNATGGSGGNGGGVGVSGRCGEYGGGGGGGFGSGGTPGAAGGSSLYGGGGGGGGAGGGTVAGGAGGVSRSYTAGGGGAAGAVTGGGGGNGGYLQGGGGGAGNGSAAQGGNGGNGGVGGGGGGAGSRASGQGNTTGGNGGRGEVQVLTICL